MAERMTNFNRAKHEVYRVIKADDSNYFLSKLFDWFIIALIAVNILVLILDTFQGFSDQGRYIFQAIERVSVFIFTGEYIMRVWTAECIYPAITPTKARIKYMRSFLAIIDLMAILPFYLPFLIKIDLRILRSVRLLRLLRIFKINRYTTALLTVGTVLRNKATQLISSMFVVIILMIIASILMYHIEYDAQPDVFENALSGLWWSVATLTTVGYGDIYPITALGKLLSAVIAILGIGLVAVPTGIISAGFIEQISNKQDAVCPHCGKSLARDSGLGDCEHEEH